MLSKFSVKRPFTVIVALIIVAILGVVSFTKSSVDLFPSMNFPYAIISTVYPGATPEQVETTVTKNIEQSMSTISNVKKVTSVSNENYSMVVLEFTDDTNMDTKMVEMREALDSLAAYFPTDVKSPTIMKINPNMMPIMSVAAYIDGTDMNEASKMFEEKIIPEIESCEGVGSVDPMGILENYVNITISKQKLDELNAGLKALAELSASMGKPVEMPTLDLTKETLEGIIKGQNLTAPAGSVGGEEVSYIVRVGDKFKDIDEIKNTVVLSLPIEGYEKITIGNLCDVIELDNSGDIYGKVNGNNAILFTIQKQSEYTTTDTTNNVNKLLSQLEDKYEGLTFKPMMDQGKYINVMVETVLKNLVIGGILAVIILLLFLKNIKSTFVVGMSIIVSVVTTFVLMYFFGITLNVISLGGLALGVGMLVDNSIIVIENIYRLRGEGMSVKEAAIQGSKEITGAITASTLTTIIVFAPIIFTTGITKQLFVDMALTIAFSLTASLLVALTFVPMCASTMLKKDVDKKHKLFDALRGRYIKALSFTLKHRWTVVIPVIVLLFVSLGTLFIRTPELFPEMDQGMISINAEMPDEYSREDSYNALDKLSEICQKAGDVDTVGALLDDNGTVGTIYVLLKEDRKTTTAESEQYIRDNTEDLGLDLTIAGASADISMLSGDPVSIMIKGKDLDTLRKLSTDITEIVKGIKGTIEVDDGLGKVSPEMRITVNKDESIKNGLTVGQVYMAVSEKIADAKAVSSIETTTSDYDIYVYDSRDEEVTKEVVENMEIETPLGTTVKIKDICEISIADGFSSINRDSQSRYVTVSAQLEDGYSSAKINEEIKKELKNYDIPEGYTVSYGGEMESLKETYSNLVLMLVLAIVFIYLVMVAQFQSLLSPFIVMFTIPLAFTGGLILLFITGESLNIVSMIGFVVLTGIVVNNGIVFVDRVNQLREQGYDKQDAIIETGRNRLRPIIMTALTTIIALLASCFDTSAEAGMMKPMALTTVGGLTYATVLTLFFVPIIYDIFNKNKKKTEEA